MCSYSAPGRINVSDATYTLIRRDFASEAQPLRYIKGKGQMATFLLQNQPPTADQAEGFAPLPPPGGPIAEPHAVHVPKRGIAGSSPAERAGRNPRAGSTLGMSAGEPPKPRERQIRLMSKNDIIPPPPPRPAQTRGAGGVSKVSTLLKRMTPRFLLSGPLTEDDLSA